MNSKITNKIPMLITCVFFSLNAVCERLIDGIPAFAPFDLKWLAENYDLDRTQLIESYYDASEMFTLQRLVLRFASDDAAKTFHTNLTAKAKRLSGTYLIDNNEVYLPFDHRFKILDGAGVDRTIQEKLDPANVDFFARYFGLDEDTVESSESNYFFGSLNIVFKNRVSAESFVELLKKKGLYASFRGNSVSINIGMQSSDFIKTAAKTSERFLKESTVEIRTKSVSPKAAPIRTPLGMIKVPSTIGPIRQTPTENMPSTTSVIYRDPFTTTWFSKKFGLDAKAIQKITFSDQSDEYLVHFSAGFENDLTRIEKELDSKGIIVFRRGMSLRLPSWTSILLLRLSTKS